MNWQENRKIEIEKIIDNTLNTFSINKEELLSKSRKKELVNARRFLLNVLFELFKHDGMLQEDISSVIKKDRTTFIYHRNNHIADYERYKKYKQEFDCFKLECENSLKETVL